MGFGITHPFCEDAEGKGLLRVGFNVIMTVLDQRGDTGVGAMLVDTHNKVFVHGMIDRAQFCDCFALDHALNIAVAHSIGGVGGEARLDGLPDAQRGEAGAAYDCL